MNTENLKTFIALTKYRNFTRTAEMLFVAQSTVTNRIAELEKEVGKKLFERERKNLTLTAEGARFLDYAVRITELEQTALSDLNLNEKYSDIINIGTTNTIFDCHLKKKLKSYIKTHKDIALKVTIAHSLPLIEMLSDGVIDFAFTYTEYRKKGFICTPFFTDEMVLVTDSENNKYKKGISRSELANVNYLYCNFTFQDIGEYIRDLFPKHHTFSFEIDRSANIIPYLRHDNGFSFLPKSLVKQAIKKGELIRIPLIDFEVLDIKSYVIFKDSARLLSDEKSEFLDILNITY